MRLVVAVVTVTLLLGACSSDGDGDDAAGRNTPTTEAEAETATEAATEAVEPEVFTGELDDFYVVPDPLPAGEPGDLIRVMAMEPGAGVENLRIMYRSTDTTGADRAVTGVLTYPTDPAPDDGWPVTSTAHGTTGIASPCALSRSIDDAPDWGIGGVRVMTDYIGQGPVGELHAYLSRVDEGNSVIDAVRAARQVPEAHASERWVSVGHSQGGHGALSAHELAGERAPELDLVATVALAPAAMLDRVYGGIDPIVTTILTMMALYGGARVEPQLDPERWFTPEALAASDVFETGCLDEITDALIPVAIDGAFTADPRRTEPARSLVLANEVGDVAVDGVPVYLASGTIDDRVVIERVRDLFDRLCAAGQVTELTVVEGADHGAIVGAVAGPVVAFLEAALAGDPPTDSCP